MQAQGTEKKIVQLVHFFTINKASCQPQNMVKTLTVRYYLSHGQPKEKYEGHCMKWTYVCYL